MAPFSPAPPSPPPLELLEGLCAFHRQSAQEGSLEPFARQLSDLQVLIVWAKALHRSGYETSVEQCFLNVGTATDHPLYALAAGPHRMAAAGQIGWGAIIQAHGCMPVQPDKFYWHATPPEPISPQALRTRTAGIHPAEYEPLVARFAAFVQSWSLGQHTTTAPAPPRPRPQF